MRALLACHACVGSQVLFSCRFRNLAIGFGGSLSSFLRIFGLGARPTTANSLPGVSSCPFSVAFSNAALRFLAAKIPSRRAVSALIRPRVVLGFLLLASTFGVLSSFISFCARDLNLRGTRFGL